MANDERLPVEDAPRFEAGWAVTEAVIVGLMGLIVLAGLAGVFGRGPLSAANAVSPKGIRLTYERFVGVGTPARFSLDLKTLSPATATVFLDGPILDHLVVTGSRPRSTSEASSLKGTTYAFQLGPDGRGTIVFLVQPSKAGIVKGAVTANGERLPFDFVVWP